MFILPYRLVNDVYTSAHVDSSFSELFDAFIIHSNAIYMETNASKLS